MVFTPAEYQPKDKNIGRIKRKFHAKWEEDKNTSLENHKKRIEQQRAQHNDPLIPDLSQIVPHEPQRCPDLRLLACPIQNVGEPRELML